MAIMADTLNSSLYDNGEALSCDLTGLPSFILQFTLGLIAFSTLIIKRCKEPEDTRRPVFIWIADSLKQAIGMLGVHFVNLFLSQLLPMPDIDHCILYLINFILDSTLGLIIIYCLFKIISVVVDKFKLTPLRSGEYGEPFRFQYWLCQCVVVLLVLLIMKLIIGPMVVFTFWKKVGAIILPFKNKEIRTAIVIFIVPFIVNVLMFWIVDSIIKSKSDSLHYKKKETPPRRKNKQNRVYLPLADLEQAIDSVGGPHGDEGHVEEHTLYSDNDELLTPQHDNRTL